MREPYTAMEYSIFLSFLCKYIHTKKKKKRFSCKDEFMI